MAPIPSSVPGVIGILQALEAIKIVTDMKGADPPSLLLFSADRTPSFRSIRLRSRKPDCAVCGDQPMIRELIDYVEFCGSGALDKSYAAVRASSTPHLLLDVREPVQFDICALEGSMPVPLKELEGRMEAVKEKAKESEGNGKFMGGEILCILGKQS
ncbi:hypothetical protein BC936DRAFT_148420 [Jimgerdemannia flammicorona]|uniref:Rhodanese domain-containing protein n=1 Tax=Jimgerdemannia flammicorona TaxID=994334 RepID=A0A433DKS0_9FUNG|nr:hypothetical protein BC936DRAFT_148420 [Jimgerdemannia flammicorona]